MSNFTIDLVNKIEEYIGDFRKKFEDQVDDVCFIPPLSKTSFNNT